MVVLSSIIMWINMDEMTHSQVHFLNVTEGPQRNNLA